MLSSQQITEYQNKLIASAKNSQWNDVATQIKHIQQIEAEEPEITIFDDSTCGEILAAAIKQNNKASVIGIFLAVCNEDKLSANHSSHYSQLTTAVEKIFQQEAGQEHDFLAKKCRNLLLSYNISSLTPTTRTAEQIIAITKSKANQLLSSENSEENYNILKKYFDSFIKLTKLISAIQKIHLRDDNSVRDQAITTFKNYALNFYARYLRILNSQSTNLESELNQLSTRLYDAHKKFSTQLGRHAQILLKAVQDFSQLNQILANTDRLHGVIAEITTAIDHAYISYINTQDCDAFDLDAIDQEMCLNICAVRSKLQEDENSRLQTRPLQTLSMFNSPLHAYSHITMPVTASSPLLEIIDNSLEKAYGEEHRFSQVLRLQTSKKIALLKNLTLFPTTKLDAIPIASAMRTKTIVQLQDLIINEKNLSPTTYEQLQKLVANFCQLDAIMRFSVTLKIDQVTDVINQVYSDIQLLIRNARNNSYLELADSIVEFYKKMHQQLKSLINAMTEEFCWSTGCSYESEIAKMNVVMKELAKVKPFAIVKKESPQTETTILRIPDQTNQEKITTKPQAGPSEYLPLIFPQI